MKTTRPKKNEPRQRITLERTFESPVEDVWDLWTTKEGIESWWGPDAFRVEVKALDLKPGGWLRYLMIAVAPETIAFMKQSGMPVEQPCQLRYSEIVPNKLLRYVHLADFIPGVEPYDVEYVVKLAAERARVRMTLTFDAMHDPVWTERQKVGWNMELGKLENVLAVRGQGVSR